MIQPTVIVYSPKGEAERHTRANARDLVNGAGYTWMPGVPTTPAAYAPFVATKSPDGPQPSQSVLDSVGSASGGASAAAKAAADAQAAELARIAAATATAPAPVVEAPVEVKDFSEAPAVDASDLDDDADAADAAEAEEAAPAEEASEESAPRRRGRPPRAG